MRVNMDTARLKKGRLVGEDGIKSNLIPLSLIFDYPVRWSKYKVLRDLIQNFYDAVGHQEWDRRFSYELNGKGLLFKAAHVDFSYDWLIHIGASTKRDSLCQYAGYFGEGFKVASLCALRDHGWNIEMASRDWELMVVTSTLEVDGRDLTSLAYQVWRKEKKRKETILCIYPFHQEDTDILKSVLMSFCYEKNPLFGKKIWSSPRAAVFYRSNDPKPNYYPCTFQYGGDGIVFGGYQAMGSFEYPLIFCLHGFRLNDRERNSFFRMDELGVKSFLLTIRLRQAVELQYCDTTVLAVPFTSNVPTPALRLLAKETCFARRRIDTLTSRTLMKHCLSILLSLGIALTWSLFAFAEIQRGGPLRNERAISTRPEWNQFRILVWQYKTSVLKDIDLYRRVGLRGFHIDRGAGKDKLVEFSIRERFPYYVDHTANKGFLYLKGNDVKTVTGKRGLVTRPHSLADPKTIDQIKQHIAHNIGTTRNGLVLAYAFDDEISLGSFVTPCDVDNHPLSIAWFRDWLRDKYGTISRLNALWNTDFKSFAEVMPQGFEEVRTRNHSPPLSKWNLSPWMDFRQFMDFQFATVLAELTRYANSIDSRIPAGFVGGQGPGPWGGYDYAMLSRSVQWMEAYDINGTNEILRSFWNQDRSPRMQTFFSTKNPKLDSWFLWYYMLHGNQAVIAWPDGWFRSQDYDIAPFVIANKDTFKEIQGPISEPIVNPNTVFDPDPIGIYYSHPSIQAGWAMDAITHGRTWINRKGSIDDQNQSMGVLRKAWCKTLEDLGYQYDFISYLDVLEGVADLCKKFKIIILPKTVCLSDCEADALRAFVKKGGTLIADYLCGLLDEHGKGRPQGAMDDLFGIERNESYGYMNGAGLTEIDGEKYQKPFLERCPYYDGAYRYKNIVVFGRGTTHVRGGEGIEIKDGLGLFHRASVMITHHRDKGRTIYLNLSPIEYWDAGKRLSSYGDTWRKMVSGIMESARLEPRVRVYERGDAANMIECLFWRNGNKRYLGLVKNPTEQKELKTVGERSHVQGITGQEVEIRLEFREGIRELINLRTDKHLGPGQVFHDRFKPWQGNLYEVVY